MKSELFKLALDVVSENQSRHDYHDARRRPTKSSIKKINNRVLSYTEKHRGQWFKPEYDLEEIQIAQDTDSYLFRAIKKKTNRFLIAGWEIVGKNQTTVDYIKTRLLEIEQASGKPFKTLLTETAHDLIRYSNCIWVKVRNQEASSGSPRTNLNGKELDPVAGYFIVPMETLSFKTKLNGDIKKIKQTTPSGETKEFSPDDIVHFYDNRKPGFAIGTPEVLPVIDDIALLRRLEENVEELVESNLYPLFHYSVGSDEFPERYGPNGEKETDVVKDTIEYMPAGGIYVSDHRHKITAIGSEGRALRVEAYLDYFKKRVFAGLGVSAVDMGEGDSANRSTAHSLSKAAIQDVEALQNVLKIFIEHFVFNELLVEGPVTQVVLEEDKVEIKFGVVDKEERTKLENQIIQLWLNKLITEQEARKALGYDIIVDRENSYYTLYEEPLSMLKLLGQPAADEALAAAESSAITPEGVAKGEKIRSEQTAQGRPPNPASAGAQSASSASARPENQRGVRSGPKFSRDDFESTTHNFKLTGLEKVETSYRDGLYSLIDNEDLSLEGYSSELIDNYLSEHAELINSCLTRAEEMVSLDISEGILLKTFIQKFISLNDRYSCKAYNYGVIVGGKSLGKDFSAEKLIGVNKTCIDMINSDINITDLNIDHVPMV